MRTAVTSDDAPKAQGVYTPAIRAGQLLFISGQIPVDPKTGAVVDGDITEWIAEYAAARLAEKAAS